MKGFAYTARDASGATKSGHINAPDRASAIREIRALNLVPISLEERAGPSLAGTSRKKLNPRVVVLSVIAVLAIVAGLVFSKKPASTPAAARSTAPGATAPQNRNQTATSTTDTPRTTATTSKTRKSAPSRAGQAPARPSSPGSASLRPPAHRALPTSVDAQVEDPPKPEPEHIFKTATEQLLAMLGRPGEMMPPLPISGSEDLGEDFKRSLTNLIAIYETDDAHEVNRKETVAWLKAQLAETEKEGWTPAEVIKALEAQRKEEADERKAAAALLAEIIREHPEQAREARARINAELLEKGLLPLDPPIGRRKKP
jgi:hypothetical protein